MLYDHAITFDMEVRDHLTSRRRDADYLQVNWIWTFVIYSVHAGSDIPDISFTGSIGDCLRFCFSSIDISFL